MDVYEVAIRRRAIRKYQNKPVPYEVLERCVNAARLAPSGMNLQICEYAAIDDEETLVKMLEYVSVGRVQFETKGRSLPAQAPRAFIILLINKSLEKEVGAPRQNIMTDVGMAAENILLVALGDGIGTCPILSFKESPLKQLLNIPDRYDIAMVISLGYPDESAVAEDSAGPLKRWVDDKGVAHVPKRKLEDILHHNRF
jgi:nitroreductase